MDALITWNERSEAAFVACKQALAKAAILAHPVAEAELRLTTDASDFAVGAVLEQVVDGHPQPLGFFSRQLRKAEIRYSAFDRELLAAYLAVRHFRYALEARTFSIWTDHKPLVQSMKKVADAWSDRQQRHLAYIT